MDLSGRWRLTDERGEHDLEIALPGDVHSALADIGILPDPYRGRNEYRCRWVAERDWSLIRTFEVERTDMSLVLDGVDTVATVSVNGTIVLNAGNAFRRHRADVSGALRKGTNEIRIDFPSSLRIAAERQAAQPFFVPYQESNCPLPNGNMLRKPQCDFGWDWNIALAPLGIYGRMTMEPLRPLEIARLHITQDHSGGEVRVTVAVHVEGAGQGTLCFDFDGMTETIDAAGPGIHSVTFAPAEPRLWWPAGLGDQPLYDLAVTLADQVERRRIGLRRIDLITEPDEIGASFLFRVNGHDVYARGANWIPADALPGRITPESVRGLLQSAVDANMNMIRIWGGGRYEPGWFYDLCDELGLMVWQDFMFACHLYPSDEAFLAEVAGEAAEAVARLHHHASIALWCGDNELVGALTWFEESRKDRDRYLAAYDRLNHTVERALKATAPEANWWPSSPSRGRLDFGDGWHDDTAGDMHFWSVWHEGRDFDHYRDVSPRFCSEFGFQSYPSMDRIRAFADPADWNIASPVLESHQKNAGGNARIAETMFRYFRFPEGFENFVYLSQVQQALAIKTAVTHWRSLKPRTMGTLYWQLNDTWPVCSWSSLDHGGGWKLLHHAAAHFYAPRLVTAVPEGDRIALRAVNDTLDAAGCALVVDALSMSCTRRRLTEDEATVPTDRAVTLTTVEADALAADEVLLFHWAWTDGEIGQDHFAHRPYKTYDIPQPGLTMKRSGDRLTLTTERPAFFVAIEAKNGARLSDNCMLVLPDEPCHIAIRSGETGALTLRDLHSATYATPEKGPTHA
ncbi:glycoside hydrolase family 2 protein [Alphaproteobacteria bacterium GH1-50]|uniref:beta-mannosidase n=1 Tax=Kangsaoukella pontilimi TaxID=2691042 RepID=A0A7C9MIM2_9RHOB|nr:glycoside hydrolase family 2 protein [Kangsaoukella pontilimi]